MPLHAVTKTIDDSASSQPPSPLLERRLLQCASSPKSGFIISKPYMKGDSFHKKIMISAGSFFYQVGHIHDKSKVILYARTRVLEDIEVQRSYQELRHFLSKNNIPFEEIYPQPLSKNPELVSEIY